MTTEQVNHPLATAHLPADTSVPIVEVTVGQMLRQRAREHPERLAVVGNRHGDGQEVRLTYAELLAEAEKVATALRRYADPGDHVALWAPNVVEWPVVQLGAALSGVVLVALNPVLRQPELEYALGHSRSVAMLHAERGRDHDMAAVAAAAGRQFPGLTVLSLADVAAWRANEADPGVLADAPTDPGLPVMLQYTSGTTGSPKGVLLRHRSLVNVARLTMDFTGIPSGVVAVNPLPMFHTAACVIGTLGPLWLGGTTVLVEQFAPAPVLDLLRREHADVLFHVPAVLGALLDAQRESQEPAPHLDVVLGGAATVPPAMIEAAEEVFGAGIVTVFGQTELAPVLSATRATDSRSDQLHTVGHPLPQVEVKVTDPVTGDTLPVGEVGEICAHGYQQLVACLDDPDATAATVDAEGFVHTGDLGSMDERGYLTLSGRLKELIIRGGENISPAEVENCLTAHPDVLEASVVGVPDARMGEAVAAVLRVSENRPGLREEIERHARERLSPYKVPSRWFLTPNLPTTPMGKVRKFRVVEQIEGGDLQEL